VIAGYAQILEELFPGFSDDVIARGGISGDPGSAIRNVGDGVRAISHPSGLTGLLGDRPTFEGVARARLAALPNVEIVEGTQAIGLMATTDRTRVTGVVTVPDGGDETTEAQNAGDQARQHRFGEQEQHPDDQQRDGNLN